jgi:transcription elongation GreA/GreB family factor
MQININQSQEVADNKTTKLSENKARQEAQRTSSKKPPNIPKKKQKLAKAGETKENLQYLITMRRKPNRRSRRRHKAQTISKTPLLSSSAPKTRHTTPVVAKKHRAVDATANLCTSS